MFVLGKAFKYAAWASIGLFWYHMYLLKKTDKPETGFMASEAFLNLARNADYAFYDMKLLLTRPPVEKLLPDRPPLPPGSAYPKTLVINMRGTLVHSEYKFGSGFEILKRPGLSVFLQRLSRFYEIVIFGDEESGIVNDICDALDPNYQMIMGRLGRESTLLKNGKYVKDLSYMNRDLKDIIYIDFSDEKVEFHKDNALILPLWEGNADDRELYDIMPFLENLAQAHGSDGRQEIKKFGREGTGRKYIEMQNARRELILKQRNSGISGMVGSLGKLQGNSTGAKPNFPSSSIGKE
eukprot:403355012